MTSACPSAADLQHWLSNGVSDEAIDALSRHVATCLSCQSVLDCLSDDPELRSWADRMAVTGGAHVDVTLRPSLAGPDRSSPSKIGPYRIDRELGRGGMGIVYLAVDEVLHRKVALKLMRRDALRTEARERFVREVRTAARIKHDNVVGVYAAGTTDDESPYLAMEYVAGPTLAEVIRERRRLPARQAVELIVQIADGLVVAHGAGIVHRDVKPANILIASSEQWAVGSQNKDVTSSLPTTHCPQPAVAKLADFGMVHDETAESALTVSGTIAGTPAYLSPEQARGESADVRSDVYSLGVTLYEMLTGEVPFRGSTHQVLLQVIDDEPRPPTQFDDAIPRDVEVIVLKALAKEPDKRYHAAAEFAADLRRWLRGEPIHARPASQWERAWRWCRRNPKVAVLTGSVAALLLALAVGGTTAAVLINRAYHRAQTDRDAAVVAGQQSEADLEVALQALTTLLDTVQAQMGHQPGLLPVKRTLVETAAKGLQKLVHRPDQAERVDRVMVKARERLGTLYLELGQTAESRAEFQAGLSAAEKLRQADPDDLPLGRSAALAHDQLGLMSQYAGDTATALNHYLQAREIRRALAVIYPSELPLKRDLAVSLGKIGDIHRLTGNLAAGLTAHVEALKFTGQMPADYPSAGQHLFDMAFVHGRLFDTYLAQSELTAAERHGQAALGFAEQRLKLEPAPGRSDVAYNLARLAQLAQRRGDLPAAIGYRRRVLDLRHDIAQSEPNSAAFRRDVYLNQGLLGDALILADDQAGARTAYEESGAVCAAEVAADPGSLQKAFDLSVCYERLTGLEARAGRFAVAANWYGKFAELAQRHEGNPQAAHWKPVELRQRCEQLEAIYEAAARLGLDDATALAAQPPDYRPTLFQLRSAKLATAGQHEEAAAAAKTAGEGATDARLLFQLACSYALCARAAGNDAAARDRYIDQALSILEDVVGREPTLLNWTPAHPDFAALRELPRFQRLVSAK